MFPIGLNAFKKVLGYHLKTMPNLSEFIKQWKLSPLFIVGLSSLSIAIAYIIKKHMDWKSNPDSKKRMLIHHLVFWGSCIPALKFLHKSWGHFERGTLRIKSPKALVYLVAAPLTFILGFEGGERLAKFLIPKKPKPLARPIPPIMPMVRPTTTPYYQPQPFQNPQIRQRPMPLQSPAYGLFSFR